MAYQLSFSDKALKSLKQISQSDSKRIIGALEGLAKDSDSKANVKRLTNHSDYE
ncbi:hypothetical protein GCM10028808_05400 [Spirosoma migulaei]